MSGFMYVSLYCGVMWVGWEGWGDVNSTSSIFSLTCLSCTRLVSSAEPCWYLGDWPFAPVGGSSPSAASNSRDVATATPKPPCSCGHQTNDSTQFLRQKKVKPHCPFSGLSTLLSSALVTQSKTAGNQSNSCALHLLFNKSGQSNTWSSAFLIAIKVGMMAIVSRMWQRFLIICQ